MVTTTVSGRPEAALKIDQFAVVLLIQRNHRFERHAAFRAIAGMILLHFRVHGAGVDGPRRDLHGRRCRSCRGLFASGMAVVMAAMCRFALGHQMHLALGAATRLLLPHF